MNASIAALAYLVAGVLFILSLRGLSSPETSRRGNTLGMIGMALAVGVTLLTLGTSGALDWVTVALLGAGVVVGGGAGALPPALCLWSRGRGARGPSPLLRLRVCRARTPPEDLYPGRYSHGPLCGWRPMAGDGGWTPPGSALL